MPVLEDSTSQRKIPKSWRRFGLSQIRVSDCQKDKRSQGDVERISGTSFGRVSDTLEESVPVWSERYQKGLEVGL
jgi:hypothetical protein